MLKSFWLNDLFFYGLLALNKYLNIKKIKKYVLEDKE